jgi:protein-L-isoaspartate(D-aspartate) O-methyltransferase
LRLTKDSANTRGFEVKRREMVERQLAARGITDEHVLRAMGEAPREAFVAPDLRRHAYEDAPLPIPEGQTISQPYIVALMAQALAIRPGDRVLEVGAGSGYASAVLGRIAAEVYGVEIHGRLARDARERMIALGYDNVHIIEADGARGLPEHAPYDAISVAAGAASISDDLLRQLRIGGRLVMPVGPRPNAQELIRVTRAGDDRYERESLGPVRFVPLTSASRRPRERDGSE